VTPPCGSSRSVERRDAVRLAVLWGERLREELPPGFDVTVSAGGRIKVQGTGAHAGVSMTDRSSQLSRLPFPRTLAVRSFFDTEARALQTFMSDLLGQPWPAPGAWARVTVSGRTVEVSFVDASGAVAHELRPIEIAT
jgi:hypothetical protein